MRFLIDNALSPRVAESLIAHGHDAVHVGSLGLAAAMDAAIFDLADKEDRIVVSADTDFGTLLAVRRSRSPSVVLFRGSSLRRPKEQVAVMLEHLADFERDLVRGAVVVIEDRRIRIRSLPIL